MQIHVTRMIILKNPNDENVNNANRLNANLHIHCRMLRASYVCFIHREQN